MPVRPAVTCAFGGGTLAQDHDYPNVTWLEVQPVPYYVNWYCCDPEGIRECSQPLNISYDYVPEPAVELGLAVGLLFVVLLFLRSIK